MAHVKSCENLQQGVYWIQANYFEGEGKEEASFFVQAGNQSKTLRGYFQRAKGKEGNKQTPTFGGVRVSLDNKTNEYAYEIFGGFTE